MLGNGVLGGRFQEGDDIDTSTRDARARAARIDGKGGNRSQRGVKSPLAGDRPARVEDDGQSDAALPFPCESVRFGRIREVETAADAPIIVEIEHVTEIETGHQLATVTE